MAKNLFSGVRAQLVGAIVATVGGIALTACNSCCDPCTGGPKVYQKPCCAQPGGGYRSCGARPAGTPTYTTPAPGPSTTTPMPAPAGGAKACGAGKCG